ncbi:hypothetical protein Tco_0708198 [Tanacetum coccineum]
MKIGYSWKPTRRIFTIVGTRYPLTRITSEIVPPKESTIALVITSDLKVYNRRPRALRSVSSSSKSTSVESNTSNTKEPNQSWGSTIFDASSSLIDCRLSKLFYGIWTLGSRDTNLYTISLDDMLKTSLIYLLSKASKTKS